MIYDLSLAGMHIRCDIPFEVKITSSMVQFMVSVEEAREDFGWDYNFRFVKTSELPPMKDGYFESDRTYVNDADGFRVYFHPCPSKPPYACVIHGGASDESDAGETVAPGGKPGKLTCLYLEDAEQYMNVSINTFSLLSPEYFFYEHGGFLIHSSFIRTQTGQGILFSAPSGTGKSTQAELWQKYRGAEILNGDRAAVVAMRGAAPAGGFTAYGLPYAGSSGIYRNESATLSAIVVLRQAPYNKVTELQGTQIVRHLYSEVMIYRWDKGFATKMLERLLSLPVPVYLLECMPDEGAVEALESRVIG